LLRVVALLLGVAACRFRFEPVAADGAIDAVRVWRLEEPSPGVRYWGIHGFSPTDVYAVGGSSSVWHWDGLEWTGQPTGLSSGMFGIHGSSAKAIYAVGSPDGMGGQTIVYSTGDGVWTSQTNTLPAPLNEPYAVSASVVYACGYNGIVAHSVGDGVWTQQATNTGEHLFSCLATPAGELYAVGGAGLILHSPGDGTWQAQTSGTSEKLIEVYAPRADDIWVVGYNGLVLHSTGDGTWQPQPTGVAFNLFAIHEVDGVLYAAGRSNQVIQSRGDGVWTLVETGLNVTTIDAFWSFEGTLFAAAENGIVLSEPR
jgi:hypothetical protein